MTEITLKEENNLGDEESLPKLNFKEKMKMAFNHIIEVYSESVEYFSINQAY